MWVTVGTVVAVGALVATVTGVLLLRAYQTARVPAPGESAIAAPTVLLDASGNEIRKLDVSAVGTAVSTDELPDHVVRAVLAAEDDGFHSHGGFSTSSILRAVRRNVSSGAVEQGASTITQQYVDLTTPGAGRTFRAKLREVAAAVKVDRALSKDEILSRYLNLVPFGRNTSGLDAAAKTYFGVPATDLDVNQAATLAGMIAAPSAFDPGRHPDAARMRRDIVVRAMGEEGWLASARVQELLDTELPELATGDTAADRGPAAYFIDAVRRRLEHHLPEDRNLSRGLVVRTTMDPRMQRLAQQTLREHVAEESYTGAIVSVDPETGEVRALVGGPSFADQPYNTAVQARRQPGSSFKPFTLAAFVADGYDPSESWYDAPAELEVESSEGTTTVHNYSGHGYGRITVRQATIDSVNTAYMQLVEDVGPREVVEVANAMGIKGDLPEVPSIALGTGAVRPIGMASAYATFASRGTAREPVLIRSVREVEGEVLHEAQVDGRRAIEEQTAGVVTSVLADVVEEGTGTAARIGRPVAGKTGTTNDSRDAWFVGFAPQLATSVWVGRLDNASMPGATGGGTAAPIWADYMEAVLEPFDVADLPTADAADLDAGGETEESTFTPAPEPEPSSTSASPTPTDSPTTSPTPTSSPTSSPTPTESSSPAPTSSPEPTESSSPTSEPTDDGTTSEDGETSTEGSTEDGSAS